MQNFYKFSLLLASFHQIRHLITICLYYKSIERLFRMMYMMVPCRILPTGLLPCIPPTRIPLTQDSSPIWDSSQTGFLQHEIPPMRDSSYRIPPTGFLPKVSSHPGFLPQQDSSNTGFLPHRIPLIEFLPHDPHRIHPTEYSVNKCIF